MDYTSNKDIRYSVSVLYQFMDWKDASKDNYLKSTLNLFNGFVTISVYSVMIDARITLSLLCFLLSHDERSPFVHAKNLERKNINIIFMG